MTQKCIIGRISAKPSINRRSGTDAQLRIELLLQHHSRRFFIPKPFCVRQDNSSTCTLRLTRPFASSHSVHDHGEKMDANRLAVSARLELASPEGRLVSTEVSYQLELTLQRPRYLFKWTRTKMNGFGDRHSSRWIITLTSCKCGYRPHCREDMSFACMRRYSCNSWGGKIWTCNLRFQRPTL